MTVAPPVEPGYADAGAVGAMALAYLRDDPARALTVEVDFVQGRAPSEAALDHLAQILERDLDKPVGIAIERGDQIPSGDGSYTFAEIDRLEERWRDRRSAGARATMWLVYLDGELEDEPAALGVAFEASGAAIFRDQLGSAATAVIRPGQIERAVLTHEAGHLLGLVNIGYSSPHDHEDPAHEGHSRYRESVMYWQVEDISIASLLSGGPPVDFDRFDRDDLRIRRDY